ncbi:TonB-dependent receptor [Tamlana sedimentorum]|uniref:TonB-dependent receptor n=1 Tax=Neotamlana sedimentorum TaxID=1435349 RepID=A0A0D7W943_9FLAO|nr:TonB-dependent receptor [Tamlana sedimentorum]KJD35203.1 TonB-dependent receptor [Tamlana sedimentorum]
MKNNLIVLILFVIGLFNVAQAQTGIIAGNVIDGDYNNEPLAFANILVKGTTTGTTSDFDGKYQMDLNAGTYNIIFSFVGYETKEISGVVINAGQVTNLDVTLASNALDEIVITTSVKRNTESAALALQKKSVTLLDAMSAQSIKKTGAGDVASAVKSVPGVSVQGGKYVYVRGLGDRYSKSILNGVDIPGLDPDRNTVQMDVFPTNIIDNIVVVKSAAAEHPADFTGGIVDVITKDFPTKAEYSISLGAAYNPSMHFNDEALKYEGSDTDIFGYDDGTRKLPINRYQPIPGTFENKTLLTTLTNRFEKQLKADNFTNGANFDLGFTLGNQYALKNDDKFGYQVAVSYKNDVTFYDERIDGRYTRRVTSGSENIFELDGNRLSTGSESINTVLLSGLVGVTYKTSRSKYKVNFLHIQNGETTSNFLEQQINTSGGVGAFEPVVKDGLLYTQRSISNLLVAGSHNWGTENDWTFDWKFAPTFTGVYDKDHRITPLQISDDGDYFISPSASSYPLQLWRNLSEENWTGKVDFTKKVSIFSSPAKIKFGGAHTYKFRDFSIDNYAFTSTNLIIPNGNSNLLLADENIWTPDTGAGTYLNLENVYEPSNSYEGESQVSATYFSAEFNFSEKLKSVLGIRTEYYSQYYTGEENDGTSYTRENIIDVIDFYPSANLIYALTEESNLRASYSRTTARPSFKEASSAQIYDPVTNDTFLGNGFGKFDSEGDVIYDPISPSYITNFDLRYEIFREEGQMIAVSGFYKSFKDPIEIVFMPNTSSASPQFTVANLGDSKVYGAELEFRQNFGFLSESLTNLKLTANASYTQSELEMSEFEYQLRTAEGTLKTGESVDRIRDLQGMSPYLINVGLDYDFVDKDIRAGLFYNVQGKTLEIVGTGFFPDIYTQPFHSLNFTSNFTLGEKKRSSISLKVNNILGEERESHYESFNAQNQVFSLRQPGTEFSLGYSLKF